MIGLLSVSCNGQRNEIKGNNQEIDKEPKGSWKVDKEFDEKGNLIRYDSVYSWSSDNKYNNLSLSERDSLMEFFKSRFFKNFSGFENKGFNNFFSQDSLFSKRFFNDNFFESDFGNDFMDIDKIRQKIIMSQKNFLEKHQSEFIKPEDEN